MRPTDCLLAPFTLLCFLQGTLSIRAPIALTNTGLVAGKRLQVADKEVDVFYGIPYARPPIGSLRFRKPKVVRSWKGVYNATTKSAACWQTDFVLIRNITLTYPPATEDCLRLNIWRPSSMCESQVSCTGKNLSVVVFIYGGGFQWGDSGLFIYDPSNFVALSDVVYVTFNHRVGVMGFFPPSPDGSSGNMGFYDQLAALKWVKRNIANFGGNPNDVTLVGQSAGAISVGLHSISSCSRGLFKRAILQSGTPITLVVTAAFSGSMLFRQHAAKLGCYDPEETVRRTVPEILDCLRRLKAQDIYNAIETNSVSSQLFAPHNGDVFVPADLFSAANWRRFHIDEILLGTTSEEGALFIDIIRNAAPDLNAVLTEDYRRGLAIALYLVFEIPVHKAEIIVEHYFGGPDVQHDPESVIRIIGSALGDVLFNCPTHFFATSTAKEGVATYMYRFDHRPSYSTWPKQYGPTHAEEVPFTIGSLPFFSDESRFTPSLSDETIKFIKSAQFAPEEYKFMSQVVGVWSSFIKKGKIYVPTTNETWPKYSEEHPELVHMKSNSFKQTKFNNPCDLFKPYLLKE